MDSISYGEGWGSPIEIDVKHSEGMTLMFDFYYVWKHNMNWWGNAGQGAEGYGCLFDIWKPVFLTHQDAGCVSGMLSGDGHEIKIYAHELETAL